MNEHFTKQDIQMANKHLKMYSLSSSVGKMQTENIMRHHYTSIRYAKIKFLK